MLEYNAAFEKHLSVLFSVKVITSRLCIFSLAVVKLLLDNRNKLQIFFYQGSIHKFTSIFV